MFSSDIGGIITTSLLKNINQVSRSNVNIDSNLNSVSFDSVLNMLSSSNSSCNCSNTMSSLDILDVVTSVMGTTNNISSIVSDVVDSTVNKGNLLEGISDIYNDKVTNNTKMDDAIKLLKEQVGKPYVWGANGPNSFDCSGLTKYIYKEALGIDIPRVSYDQANYGLEVAKEDLQVGDLVFFDTMNKGRVSHVGIYIGNNEFIHASNKRDGVKLSKLEGYYIEKYKGARRPS